MTKYGIIYANIKKNSISIKKLWLLWTIWENVLSETTKSSFHHIFPKFVEMEKDTKYWELKKTYKC